MSGFAEEEKVDEDNPNLPSKKVFDVEDVSHIVPGVEDMS